VTPITVQSVFSARGEQMHILLLLAAHLLLNRGSLDAFFQ
jgi:hypothetical protein